MAHGAVHAGLGFACGYPGTPSTEVLETLASLGAGSHAALQAQWCINEKVALETGIGAALAGKRTLVTMKHVGLNVAADPFMTLTLTGVNAGLVVLSADDPGMHSSQNEQDNRAYAKFAKVPLLEPSDSQEAYDFLAEALALSEEFDTPVVLRTTTRVAHARGTVLERPPIAVPQRDFQRDIAKYVMVPGYARARNRRALERLSRLRARAETTPLNFIEAGTADYGIITSGVAYQYAREAFPKAWFLKLGMSFPLPQEKVAALYASVSKVAVVEELDPFLEEQVRALGVPVIGKEFIPADGELNQEIVHEALAAVFDAPTAHRQRRRPVPLPQLKAQTPAPAADLPVRPPVLCAGCPHRAVFAMLRKRKVVAMGDIGCYTLGALEPLLALDTCLNMGASVGMMAGMNAALGRKAAVAVIGDSTFFHSGVSALIDARYNESDGLVIVLDNRTTAMTGHQGHPGTGVHLDRSQGPDLDIERLCAGIGVRCQTVDAFDTAAVEAALKDELAAPGLGVLVARAPCVLQAKPSGVRVVVDAERCTLCGLCLDLGCPALAVDSHSVRITDECTGCGVCVAVCKRGALKVAEVVSGEERHSGDAS